MNPPDPFPPASTARDELRDLRLALDALRDGYLSACAFCTVARGQSALQPCLPPRYGEVLLNLLDRLESSALFTEESCSFSQRELHDSLALWLDKAHAQLERTP